MFSDFFYLLLQPRQGLLRTVGSLFKPPGTIHFSGENQEWDYLTKDREGVSRSCYFLLEVVAVTSARGVWTGTV